MSPIKGKKNKNNDNNGDKRCLTMRKVDWNGEAKITLI